MRLPIYRSSRDLKKFHLRRALARDTISLYSTSVPGLLAPVGAGRVPVNEKRNLRGHDACILSLVYWEIRMVWNNERENILQFIFLLFRNLYYIDIYIYMYTYIYNIQFLQNTASRIIRICPCPTQPSSSTVTFGWSHGTRQDRSPWRGTRWNDISFTKRTANRQLNL